MASINTPQEFMTQIADLRRQVEEGQKRESLLRDSAELASVLLTISRAVNVTHSLEELFSIIHEALGVLVDVSNIFIALLDRERNLITFPYFVDECDAVFSITDADSSGSLTAEMIKRESTMILKSADIHEHFLRNGMQPYGTLSKVWVGVPLRVDGQVIGALGLQHYHDENRYSPTDIQILEIAAESIAIAIRSKQTEQELQRERDLLQNFMDTIPDTIYVKDRLCRFTRINRAQARVLGVTDPEQAKGLTDFAFFPEEQAKESDQDDNAVLSSGEALVDKTERIRRADGHYRWVSTTKFPMRSATGEIIGLAGVTRDITERKEAEEELTRFAAELKDHVASQEKFISILAHDLKTPFQGLLGFCDIVTEDFDTLSKEELRRYVSHIKTTAKSAYTLLENLLEWSRVHVGRIEMHPKELVLMREVDDVFHLLDGTAVRKSITLRNLILERQRVLADQHMVQSILRNLISNAIKFTSDRGTVTVYAQAVEEEGNSMLQISVRDTGIGISKDHLPLLFQIDKQFTSRGTNDEPGTGLGLLLCKEMVERHKGQIRVESTLGSGTVFTFTLPRP